MQIEKLMERTDGKNHLQDEFRSGEPPKSWIRVGFGFRVSGFGFRVLSIETNFRCRFRVSGFDRSWGK